MAIRCKMRLENVFANTFGGAKAIFRSQYDQGLIEEDLEFSKATPNAVAEFEISNPKAAEQLIIGQDYYFDIHAVPKPSTLI
jgi:hypothetical protein